MIEIKYNKDSVTIIDSYLLQKTDIYNIAREILNNDMCPSCIKRRSVKSIANEIMAHNLLYECGYEVNRTKDADIDQESIFRRYCYFWLSIIWRMIH